MANVAIWMSPEPGHLFPALKIAGDLRLRGHNVTLVAPTGVAADLREMGFAAVDIFAGRKLAAEIRLLRGEPTATEFVNSLRTELGSWAALRRETQQELRRVAGLCEADLFLIDGSQDDFYEITSSRPMDPRRLVRLFPHLPSRRHPAASFFGALAPACVLAPPAFAAPDSAGPNLHYTEAALFPGTPGAAPQATEDRPIVLASLGSQARSYPGAGWFMAAVCYAARACPDFRFVVSTCGINLGDLSAGTEPLATVPQRQLLERAAVMITHGGLGSVKECIWHQVPMLVAPQAYDQPDNAERVVRHGLGLRLGPGAGPAEIEQGIRALSGDPEFRGRLARMSASFRDCEAAAPTAAFCEERLVRAER